jgi:hypothetical protein
MRWLAPWAESRSGLHPNAECGRVPRIQVPPTQYICLSLSQVDPYLPYEYTCEGMLERIHAYIQHQVGGPLFFCPRDLGLPPQNLIKPESGPGQCQGLHRLLHPANHLALHPANHLALHPMARLGPGRCGQG